MSFSGDLEHLSIIDIIQLLHTTRQTGTLKMAGRKGEISVAFRDGYIVGACHYDHDARIGSILTETGVISKESLEKALMLQELAGLQRKPLIATLLENSLASRDAAYRGLETLIELAIVEILTWKKGVFTLQVDEITVSDEFRYFPEHLGEALTLPTEHVLMDALRIFDEKMRDGLLQMEEEPSEAAGHQEIAAPQQLSADDLGLGDLEHVKRKLPGFHEALRDDQQHWQQGPDFNEILKQTSIRLQQVTTLPETALVLLETVAALFPRALTLVVWDQELVAERGIGIPLPHEQGVGPILGFRLQHTTSQLCRFILDKGLLFYGTSQDTLLTEQLYPQIGAPAEPTVLLLPLKLGKRVVALIYADFGSSPATEIPVGKLEGCAGHAGIAIESALLRKQQTANSN